jgi:hypothetical protein
MTSQEMIGIFARNGFLGYMWPNYGLKNCVEEFMRQYPRGQGIKAHETELLKLYAACRLYKVSSSRSKNYRELEEIN